MNQVSAHSTIAQGSAANQAAGSFIVPPPKGGTPVDCINKFCGRGKTYLQLLDCIEILKDAKSTRRKVICAPTITLLMEWANQIKEAVGDKIFDTRCGRLFNITPEQINNMAALLGPNHSSVCMARKLKESSKASILDEWSVILTTHSTGWSRINSFGRTAEVVFDEIPLEVVSFHEITDASEYEAMKEIKAKGLKHNVFGKAKALAKQLNEGRINLHFYTDTTKVEGKEDVVTNHAIQFWNFGFAKVKSVTFCSACAEWTFLALLAELNNVVVPGMVNEQASEDMKAAIDLFTFKSKVDNMSQRCSKAAHYRVEDDKKSQEMRQVVDGAGGFVVGFKLFESEQNRNVRFGLAGLNALAHMTTAGVDGLPRLSPQIVSGIRSVMGDRAEEWVKGFCVQSIIQSLWRGAVRKGENMDVWIWSHDVANLFAWAKGSMIRVQGPTKTTSYMGSMSI